MKKKKTDQQKGKKIENLENQKITGKDKVKGGGAAYWLENGQSNSWWGGN